MLGFQSTVWGVPIPQGKKVEKGLLSVLLWSGAVPDRIQGAFFASDID
jgi:hypothetical protein